MAVLDLERDIVSGINMNFSIFSYDLPYVLKTDQMEKLLNLIENAPTAYSLDIEESPTYSGGMILRLIRLE